jgi:hypothetical protein
MNDLRYAVGLWDSVWPCAPYMSHRIVVDLSAKRVAAGQDRVHGRWQTMSIKSVDYMQQIIDETFPDLFENPHEYQFQSVDDPPQWALEAWPWAKLQPKFRSCD